jgi:hypothetical protein
MLAGLDLGLSSLAMLPAWRHMRAAMRKFFYLALSSHMRGHALGFAANAPLLAWRRIGFGRC